MNVAIMQPYFLPYLGYFALIKHTGMWVVFDTPQFIRHGWIERNRILKQYEGWQYIKVPLEKHSRSTTIRNVQINNNVNWQKKNLAQLTLYKKKAPFYDVVINILNKLFDKHTDSIVDINVYALQLVCEYIGIDFNYLIFSDSYIKLG